MKYLLLIMCLLMVSCVQETYREEISGTIISKDHNPRGLNRTAEQYMIGIEFLNGSKKVFAANEWHRQNFLTLRELYMLYDIGDKVSFTWE